MKMKKQWKPHLHFKKEINNELKVKLKQQGQKLIEAEKSLRKYKEEHAPKVVGRITARVEPNQIIAGQIEITEKGGLLDN